MSRSLPRQALWPTAARRVVLCALCLGAAVAALPAAAAPAPEGIAFFEEKIRPVLVQHCYECHSAEALREGRLKAELLVDSRAGLEKGGESGAAVVPGKREESLLLAAVKYDGFEMPPTGKLPPEVIADFERWIEMGAPDPREAEIAAVAKRTIDVAAGREHWSYRRLQPVFPPEVQNTAWVANGIDPFVLAKLEDAGISPNQSAPRETLARRLFYDLHGLPPTPGELQLFLADSSPQAYEKLVDRLLASPRYGERWGRHWLDAVRYAESGGYEFDGDRPGAYHYRDFVIRALNADMPYDEFLRLQIAGDLLQPGDYRAVSATGFFVAGPYPGQLTAKTTEPIRYDQLDDMVTALGSGMLGMTIGCARCHDHKYDAISHRDYYAMISTLQNTVHTTVKVDPDPAATQLAQAEWEAKRAPVLEAANRFRQGTFPRLLAAWQTSPAAAVTAPWLTLNPQKLSANKATLTEEPDDVVVASGKLEGDDIYRLTFRTYQQGLKGLRLEALSSPSAPGGGPGTGANGAFRLNSIKLTASPLIAADDRKEFTPALRALAATHEEGEHTLAKAVDGDGNTGWSTADQPGRDQAAVLEFDREVGFPGGTRLTLELNFQSGQPGLARLRCSVTKSPQPVILEGQAVPQAAPEIATLTDELKTAGKDVASDEPAGMAVMRWLRQFDPQTDAHLDALEAIDAQKPGENRVEIYATGSGGGDVFVLARGEVGRKQEKAQAGFVRATTATDQAEADLLVGEDGQPLPHPRLGLARFLTNTESGAGPLAARVAVNRLWHHHFGRGIAATPNDLGTQGEPPTHPELLEWLAGQFVQGGWSLKKLHRLIVTSATYRQAGTVDSAARDADPDNRLLWHRQPVRLEGEAIRDALLAVAGRLDNTMYGPGTLDVSSPRRSIYLTVKRSQPIPFLQVFDQPEAIQSVGSRGAATVPTQALALMNAPFVRTAAEGLAARAKAAVGSGGEPAIAYAFRAALSRSPAPAELEKFWALLQARELEAGSDESRRAAALADICQLMLCMNECVYID